MEVRKGYKQTEVGVIPEDWKVDKLGSVIKILTDFTANGSFASLAHNVKYLDTTNYARLIRLTDIRADFKNNGIYISKDSYDFLAKSKLFGDELLLANVGAYAGYSFLYQKKLSFRGSLGPNMFLIKFEEQILDSKYAFYSFGYDIILQQLLSKSASSAQPKLNKQNVRECDICYPPTIEEQTAIATALSDTDALIDSLKKIIEKKRAIKQAAIQELMQPNEGWVMKTLGEIFSITAGGDLDIDSFSDIRDEKYPYPIYSNSLTNKGLYGYTSYNRHFENTITVTARGQIGVANSRNHKYTAIGRVIVLNPIIEVDVVYISEYINNYIEFSIESTGVPQLTAPQISKYEIAFPPIKEQTRIATILSDMDSEIACLEEKLSKYKQVKQGMMQELLTGRVRLVV